MAREIEPDMASKSVKGKVKIQFRTLLGNLGEIQQNAGVLEIDAVYKNKRALKFEKKSNFLNVSLSRLAKLNEKLQIEIQYRGISKSGIKFFPEQNQIYTVFSTSQRMPCVDAPSDRATFRLNLITRKDFKVAGNGRLIKPTNLPDDKVTVRNSPSLIDEFKILDRYENYIDYRQKINFVVKETTYLSKIWKAQTYVFISL